MPMISKRLIGPMMRKIAPALLMVWHLATSAACSCGAPAVVRADASALDDAAYPDAPPGPELCTDGIRRVDVTLPTVTPGSSPDRLIQTSRSFVGADEVLASRVDQLGNAQFARIDPRDGHVRAVGVGNVPEPVDATQAFRRLADGSTEVLFSGAGGTSTQFVVAAFAADASFVSARVVAMPVDPVIQELRAIVGAAATPDGFVVIGEGQSHTSPIGEAVLVEVGVGARLERIGVAWPQGSDGALVSLNSADGQTVWLAATTHVADTGAVSGVVVGHFDASASPFAPSMVSLPLARGDEAAINLRIDVASDGTALLGVETSERTVLAWIDATLTVQGVWAYPVSDGRPQLGGAAGSSVDQAIVFRLDDQVRVGRGFGPGVIAGGVRPLLDGLTQPVGYFGPHDAFGPRDTGFVLATWTPNLSLVTFCEAP